MDSVEITIEVLPREGAFKEALELEMHGACVDAWLELLRWARGVPVTPGLRAEAERLADEVGPPPWGDDA